MLTSAQIKDVLRDSLVRLNEEKAEGQKIPISDATVLLGTGTLLDSLDFVVIVTDIEDQLQALTGQVIPLGTDMQAFDDSNPFRTVATLKEHIGMLLSSGNPND
jgi:acyl carrier protein